jgi:hypothetical protein
MKAFEVPVAPGLVIGSDFFDSGADQYIIFVDLFSSWIEFFKIPTKDAKNLIRALRSYMTRNGVPRVFTSDQGSAYTSHEFENFCKEMGIRRVDGSAKHERGNAHAEASVKKVKKLLARCRSEDEVMKAILAWHQTPIAPGRPSPAQIHLGRNVRDELHWNVQQACVQWGEVKTWKEEKQLRAKQDFDKGTRVLKSLDEGQEVFVRIDDEWKEGKIVKQLDRPRSYEVEMQNGRRLERNRVKIKPNESRHSKKPTKPVTFSNVFDSQQPRPAREGQFPVAWPRPGGDDDLRGGQRGNDCEGVEAEPEREELRPVRPEEEREETNDHGTEEEPRAQSTEGSYEAPEEPTEQARGNRVKKKVRRLIEEM